MPKFLGKKTVIGLIILILLGFAVYRYRASTNDSKSAPYRVKRDTIKDILSLSGTIEADEKTSVGFSTSGLLSSVSVKKGDEVKKGQVLASLDTRQTRKTLDKYLNTYIKTRQTFDQNIDNDKNQVVTDALKRITTQYQSDLNNSVLDVEIQNLAVQLSSISTPIDGVVTHIDFPYPGVNVATTSKIEIINPLTLYFEVSADQTEVTKLHIGDPASIVLDSFPEATISGTIYKIGFTPKEDETGTVYAVSLALNNAPVSLYRVGMTGDVSFILSEKNDVLVVLPRYIKSDEKGKYVQVGKKKIKTYVETGIDAGDMIEVTSGLSEGQELYD